MWATLYCIVAQRRPDGVALVVLETADGQYLRCPPKYEASFELCLRHLHKRHTPLDGAACNIGALLVNRATEALKLPGRYVPLADGSVEDLGDDAGAAPRAHRDEETSGSVGDELEESQNNAAVPLAPLSPQPPDPPSIASPASSNRSGGDDVLAKT